MSSLLVIMNPKYRNAVGWDSLLKGWQSCLRSKVTSLIDFFIHICWLLSLKAQALQWDQGCGTEISAGRGSSSLWHTGWLSIEMGSESKVGKGNPLLCASGQQEKSWIGEQSWLKYPGKQHRSAKRMELFDGWYLLGVLTHISSTGWEGNVCSEWKRNLWAAGYLPNGTAVSVPMFLRQQGKD